MPKDATNMGLFTSDLYRSFFVGFGVGTLGVAIAVVTRVVGGA